MPKPQAIISIIIILIKGVGGVGTLPYEISCEDWVLCPLMFLPLVADLLYLVNLADSKLVQSSNMFRFTEPIIILFRNLSWLSSLHCSWDSEPSSCSSGLESTYRIVLSSVLRGYSCCCQCCMATDAALAALLRLH